MGKLNPRRVANYGEKRRTNERSKWDKKLRLHPPVHVRVLRDTIIVFEAAAAAVSYSFVLSSGQFDKELGKKCADHFHQADSEMR